MNQTEQVQNLLASLIFMDKASFISFDNGSPFAMNHDKAPASEVRDDNRSIDSSVPLLSSEPQQIHSIQIGFSEREKIHGSGIAHEHHDYLESTELDSSLGYKTVLSSHGWTELYPSFPIHSAMAESGAVEITDTPFDKPSLTTLTGLRVLHTHGLSKAINLICQQRRTQRRLMRAMGIGVQTVDGDKSM